MEFSGQYLTYIEYVALGGTLPETSFNVLEFEARNQIDLRTQNRLIGQQTIPQKVKLCDFRLIEKIQSYVFSEKNVAGNVSSESTDGYSVSYITVDRVQEVVKSKNAELQDIMLDGLYGVVINGEHIIYNGGV